MLGKMVALIYVIEWQKQGPPHAHILGICDNANKPKTIADYDSVVCAEIPDKDTFPELYQIVTKFMMHGPCGVANPNSPCMEDGKCTKKFPKDFTEVTMECDGYPQYRRRDDGKYIMKNGVPLDNRHIVPYNPYLSKKYNAHINVEICSTINSCKYLYKYVYKGPDMASVQVVDNQGDALDNTSDTQPKEQDEIKFFVNLQFITASESYWCIFLGMMSMGMNQVFKDLLFMRRTCKLYSSKRMM